MIERYIIFIYFKGLPVSLLSMLLALSGAGVLAAGVILKSYMGKKKESEFFQNLSDEITTEWRYHLEMSSLWRHTVAATYGPRSYSRFINLYM